jgi:hypothetical protein
MRLKRLMAAVGLGVVLAAPAAADIVYTYEVGSLGFTYTSPSLLPGLISAVDLDRCDFGPSISCVSVSISDNNYQVRATDSTASDPNQTLLILNLGGCTYFNVGGTYPRSSCGDFLQDISDEKYRPLSLGTLTLTQAAAVPEPGSLALVALGIIGLGISRRRGARV